jgi:hypothetical protein
MIDMGREQKQRKRNRKRKQWKIRCEAMFYTMYRAIKRCSGKCYMCADVECKKHPINNDD